jgi:hypothetical protein
VQADSQGVWYANITNNSYTSYYITWSTPGAIAGSWNFSLSDLSKSGISNYNDNGHYLCLALDSYYAMASAGACSTTLNKFVPTTSGDPYAYGQSPFSSYSSPQPFVEQSFELFNSVTNAPLANTLPHIIGNFSGEIGQAFESIMGSAAMGTPVTPPTISGYWFPVGYSYVAQFCESGYYCTNESFQADYNTTSSNPYPVYIYPLPSSTPPAVSYIQGMVMGEYYTSGHTLIAEAPVGGANLTLNYTSGMAPVLFANYTNISVVTNGEPSSGQVINFTLNAKCDGSSVLACQLDQNGPWNVSFTATFPGGTLAPPGPPGHPDLSWYMDDQSNPGFYNYYVKLPTTPSVVATNSNPIVLTMWFNKNSTNPYTYNTSNASSVFGLYADWNNDQMGSLPINASAATYYNGVPFSAQLTNHPNRRAIADGTTFNGANITVLPYAANPDIGPTGSEGGANIPIPVSGLLINSTSPYFIQYALNSQMTHGSWRILTTGTTYWSGINHPVSLLVGMGSYTNGTPLVSYGTFTGFNSYYLGAINGTAWTNVSGFNYTTPRFSGVLPSQVGNGIISYSMIDRAASPPIGEWQQVELIVNMTTDRIIGEGYDSPTSASSVGPFGAASETLYNRSWSIPHTGIISLVTGSAQLSGITSVYAIPYVAHWPTVTPDGISHGTEKVLGQTPFDVGSTGITVTTTSDGRFLIAVPSSSPAYNHELFFNLSAPSYDQCGKVHDWPVFLAPVPQNNSTTVDIMLNCQNFYQIAYSGTDTNSEAYFNGYALGIDNSLLLGATTADVFPDWRVANTYAITKAGMVSNYTSLTFQHMQVTSPCGVGSAGTCTFAPVTYSQYTSNPLSCSPMCKPGHPVQPMVPVNVAVRTLPSWSVVKGNANGLEYEWLFGSGKKATPILTYRRVLHGLQVPMVDMGSISFAEVPAGGNGGHGPTCTGHFHCWVTTNYTIPTFSLQNPSGFSGIDLLNSETTSYSTYVPGSGLPCLKAAYCPAVNLMNSNPTGVGQGHPTVHTYTIIKFASVSNFHGLTMNVGIDGDHVLVLSLVGSATNKANAPEATLLYHGFYSGTYRVSLTNTTTGKPETANDFTTTLQSQCAVIAKTCSNRDRYISVNWSNYATDANFSVYKANSIPPVTYVVSGRVTDSSGTPIASATVTLQGISGGHVYLATAQTNNSGYYVIPLVVNGYYYLNGSAPTSIYGPDDSTVTVNGSNVTKNLVLTGGGGVGPTTSFEFNMEFWEMIGIIAAVSVGLLLLFLVYEKKHKKWPYGKKYYRKGSY